MKTLTAGALVLMVVWLLAPAREAWAVDPARLSDPAQQARYEVLIHELRCVQCENNSLADSDADIATDVRRQIRTMLVAGQSDDQIKAYLVSRYSEFILFRPEYSWRNAWLWALPGVLLIIGVISAVRIIRQRAMLVDGDDADVPQI
ncbi:MAG TPA: cytochrome c-type biogenesis protein [Steroidobacteraceae bacterium]|nr:cytochrome c-type biogenesis protein [Steroidobacteraceae bacterium]